jgi:hypothetical protein
MSSEQVKLRYYSLLSERGTAGTIPSICSNCCDARLTPGQARVKKAGRVLFRALRGHHIHILVRERQIFDCQSTEQTIRISERAFGKCYPPVNAQKLALRGLSR